MTAGPAAFGLPLADEALAAALTGGMAEVEAELRTAVDHVDGYLAGASRHVMEAGGKRFRPLLTLLAAQLGKGITDEVVRSAVVVELTHLASLYHDDVMDEADLRRGADSANARYGNTVAILTGDLLFSRASALVADLGPEAVKIQAETFVRLVTGQVRETVGPGPGEDPVEHYLEVLADKTGSLIATCGRFGGLFAGVEEAHVQILQTYGEAIGVAFQLADDLIDLSSESEESGKTPGTDLRAGVPTLPVLLARRSTDPADARLLELLSGDLDDDARHAEALHLLREHPAMAEADRQTRQWADHARESLSPLPDGPVKDALAALADSVVERSA